MIKLDNPWVSFSLVVLIFVGLCLLGAGLKDFRDYRILEKKSCEVGKYFGSGDMNQDGVKGPDDISLLRDLVYAKTFKRIGDLNADCNLDGQDIAILQGLISGSITKSKLRSCVFGSGDMNTNGILEPEDIALLRNIISINGYNQEGDLDCSGVNDYTDVTLLQQKMVSSY